MEEQKGYMRDTEYYRAEGKGSRDRGTDLAVSKGFRCFTGH